MLMMGLRLAEGVDTGRYAAVERRAACRKSAWRSSPRSGSLPAEEGRLRATDAGRAVLDAVLRRLIG